MTEFLSNGRYFPTSAGVGEYYVPTGAVGDFGKTKVPEGVQEFCKTKFPKRPSRSFWKFFQRAKWDRKYMKKFGSCVKDQMKQSGSLEQPQSIYENEPISSTFAPTRIVLKSANYTKKQIPSSFAPAPLPTSISATAPVSANDVAYFAGVYGLGQESSWEQEAQEEIFGKKTVDITKVPTKSAATIAAEKARVVAAEKLATKQAAIQAEKRKTDTAAQAKRLADRARRQPSAAAIAAANEAALVAAQAADAAAAAGAPSWFTANKKYILIGSGILLLAVGGAVVAKHVIKKRAFAKAGV